MINPVYELQLELDALDTIYVQGDHEQTFINYLAADKARNDSLMQYYRITDPEKLHYEIAFRISALIDLIEL
jgi:hypothetical protein